MNKFSKIWSSVDFSSFARTFLLSNCKIWAQCTLDSSSLVQDQIRILVFIVSTNRLRVTDQYLLRGNSKIETISQNRKFEHCARAQFTTGNWRLYQPAVNVIITYVVVYLLLSQRAVNLLISQTAVNLLLSSLAVNSLLILPTVNLLLSQAALNLLLSCSWSKFTVILVGSNLLLS